MKKDPGDVDIINEVLEACIVAYPISPFIISIYKQYLERGSLSKKQLQGLYGKASKVASLAPGKLATLEAMIKKMATRFKSELPAAAPLYQKEESTGQLLNEILHAFPQHKRTLFLKSKFDNNETLTPAEHGDLKKFHQLIAKKNNL